MVRQYHRQPPSGRAVYCLWRDWQRVHGGRGRVVLRAFRDGGWVDLPFQVAIVGSMDLPGFGPVEIDGVNVPDQSPAYGALTFTQENLAFSHSLQSWLATDEKGVQSLDYGILTPTGYEQWIDSTVFGRVHFGQDAAQYAGWVHSTRFGWMRFVGEDNSRYLWASHLQTWLAVNPNGSFHSFDFGLMIPQPGNPTRYNTRIGMITADPGNPEGWLTSDRFGFVWFARDGQAIWFWSTALHGGQNEGWCSRRDLNPHVR